MQALGTSSVNVSRIHADYLQAVWPHIEELVDRLAELPGENVDAASLYLEVMRNEAQLWVAMDGMQVVGITATKILIRHTGEKVMLIFACAGYHISSWYDVTLANIEDWARLNDCTRVDVVGRKGWEKRMAAGGYKVVMVHLTKDLRHG